MLNIFFIGVVWIFRWIEGVSWTIIISISSGSLSPGGFWSFVRPLEAVWELWIIAGAVLDMCLPNATPELVPAFLEFCVVQPIVFIVRVVIIKGSEFQVWIYCYEPYCWRFWLTECRKYFYRWVVTKSSRSRSREMIQLQLMCCTPWILSSSQFTRGRNRSEWGRVINEELQDIR